MNGQERSAHVKGRKDSLSLGRASLVVRCLRLAAALAMLPSCLTAQLNPAISADSQSLDFGEVNADSSPSRVVTLTLALSGPFTVPFNFSIQTTGPFLVSPDRGVLGPGGHLDVKVTLLNQGRQGEVEGKIFVQATPTSGPGHIASMQIPLHASITATTKGPNGGPPEEAPPRWNSWIRTYPSGAPVETLERDKLYNVQFDLAALDYAKYFQGVESAGVDIAFTRELSKIPDPTTEVLVVPVLLGRGLKFIDGQQGARTVTIDLDRLRHTPTDWSPNDPLPSVAQKVRAMGVSVGVETTDKGCAAIALTIWSPSLIRPLDHVVRQVNIGGAPSCEGGGQSIPLKAGILSLLALPYEQPAAAALHVFETRVGNASPVSAAVFVRAGAEPLSWRPSRLLSEFVGTDAPQGLRHQIQLARCAHAAGATGCEHDYSTVANQLQSVLFHDESQAGQASADNALTALGNLTESTKPNVFIRLVDAEGRNLFLPLGLLGLAPGQFLGRKANIVTPLPRQNPHDPDGCVGPWKLVLPDQLANVDDVYLKPLASALTAADRISKWKDFVAYAGSPQAPSSEGFLLLSHHGGGLVSFDPNSIDSLQPENFKHPFRTGSVAVLAGCSVAQLVGDNQGLPFLATLNNLGVSAAIVSPFDIQGPVGARFAVHFADVVEKARQTNEQAEFQTLYERTLEDVRKDPLVSAFAAELDELLLIGDNRIRLCKKGP